MTFFIKIFFVTLSTVLMISNTICEETLTTESTWRTKTVEPEGICSRPNLPPNANIRLTSPEKIKFAEKDTIYVICQEHQFPHHIQNRTCSHGQWQGPQARCGSY